LATSGYLPVCFEYMLKHATRKHIHVIYLRVCARNTTTRRAELESNEGTALGG